MNFLAHLQLAGNDENLRLGALLGDFVRGRSALEHYPAALTSGILLHRHIDSFTDRLPSIADLRSGFRPPFRRYAGIIIDLGFDHILARRWEQYSDTTLDEFDAGVRRLLSRHRALVPPGLERFMAYADTRGLFAAYRDRDEILHSLKGIGGRLSRPNPLHRAGEVWDEFEARLCECFEPAFGAIQSEVSSWLKTKSTITGS